MSLPTTWGLCTLVVKSSNDNFLDSLANFSKLILFLLSYCSAVDGEYPFINNWSKEEVSPIILSLSSASLLRIERVSL